VGARFSAPVQTGPRAHPVSCTMGSGSFPGKERPGRDADTSPLLVSWSRKSRAIPVLPLWPYGLYRTLVPVQERTVPFFTFYQHFRQPVVISSSLLLLYNMCVSCHRPFLPGTSLEPAVIPTAHASSFTLQYFPYYV